MTANDYLKHAIRPDVQALQRYVVQPADNLIKLDAMENPYTLPDNIQIALTEHLSTIALNRYPSSHSSIIKALRAAHNIPNDYDIMLGNGSDELIHLIIQACALNDSVNPHLKPVIMAPTPSFVMYAISSQLNQCDFKGIDLTSEFNLDIKALLTAIQQDKPRVLFLSYPNNPTGNLWAKSDIETCITAMQSHHGVVVIDEAYQAFSSDTYLNCLSDYPNVILIRTLSKLGLAGLRLGYMVAHSSWIEQFDKVRPPYNINVLTLATTTFLLNHHHDLFVYQAQALIKQRHFLFNTLNEPQFKHAGFKPYPSQANFILCKVPNASFYFNALKERGILIKNTSNQHALLHDTLRFTVSHDAENRALITALKHIFTTY